MKLETLLGAWVLQRLARGGQEPVPATAVLDRGVLVIEAEGRGAPALVVRLAAPGDALVGKALIGEPPLSVDVEVRIEDGGARLVATPSGFASLEEWELRRP